jgi:hypothetical protein
MVGELGEGEGPEGCVDDLMTIHERRPGAQAGTMLPQVRPTALSCLISVMHKAPETGKRVLVRGFVGPVDAYG